jgi:hypothetical protein
MAKAKNKNRFGVFYKSHGKWTGPYAGATFSAYTVGLRPFKEDVAYLRSFLKSRIEVRPVKTSK